MNLICGKLLEPPGSGFVSFLRAQLCQDIAAIEADVAFLGAPYGISYSLGQCRSAGAPDYIREKSLRFMRVAGASGPAVSFDRDLAEFSLDRIKMLDCGNVLSRGTDYREAAERAEIVVRKLLDRKVFPVVFGGDDAVPIPVLRACENIGPVTVIQLDEHLDFAHEINGVREGFSSPMRRASEMPWVRRVVHIGARGYGTCEQVEATMAAGNLIIRAEEVHEKGAASVLAHIERGEKCFISVDCDGLDPSCCPAVSHPEPGGLVFREADAIFRGLAEKASVAGIVFAEMVPAHDIYGIGGHAVSRLLINLLHGIFSGKF